MRKMMLLLILAVCLSLAAMAADKTLTPQESLEMVWWWGDTTATAAVVGSECVFTLTPKGTVSWGQQCKMVRWQGGPFAVGDVWKQRFTLPAGSPYSVVVKLHGSKSGSSGEIEVRATLEAGQSVILQLTISEAIKWHGYDFETNTGVGLDPIKVGETTPYVVKVGPPVDPIDPTRPYTPAPVNGATLVPVNLDLNGDSVIDGLSWLGPDSEPNMTVVSYTVYLDTVNPPVTDVTALDTDGSIANQGYKPNANLAYDTTYYWRVDTVINDLVLPDPNVRTGLVWSFATITSNPVPDAGSNVVTSLDMLPASIAGTITDANGDLTAAEWTLLTDDNDYLGLAARKQAMQMIVRPQIYPSDPNLLKDWIGTDTREKTGNVEKADPLKLTISGLPAGSYAWTSYHHDPENQTGQFDVTISDSDGPQTISNVDISAGIVDPVTTVTATIVADGTNPVVLSFDQLPWNDVVANAMFVMNGFTLVKDADSLKVDFGSATSDVQPGFSAYTAEHEVANTFTAQSFSAFGTTVTVNPDWGTAVAVAASVTPDTPFDVYAPKATFTTDTTGTYKVRLTGTDAAAGTGSDYMRIQVYADPCAAAKANPNGYTKPQFDFNNNCREDLADFALFAGKWLEDNNLTGQAAFTSTVTYTAAPVQP